MLGNVSIFLTSLIFSQEWYKPASQLCAVATSEKFWRATGQSNLADKWLAATKASKVWFSYSHNCTLANGAVFHSVCQVWLSSDPPECFTFSYCAWLWNWFIVSHMTSYSNRFICLKVTLNNLEVSSENIQKLKRDLEVSWKPHSTHDTWQVVLSSWHFTAIQSDISKISLGSLTFFSLLGWEVSEVKRSYWDTNIFFCEICFCF